MGERRMDNAGAKRPCAHTVAVRATHQTCAPTNFAASTAEAPTQQPTKAAHSNICALSQTDLGSLITNRSGLGRLPHTQKH